MSKAWWKPATNGEFEALSLIIPVYENEANLDRLLGGLVRLDQRLKW
jgi:hypothetical protein